MWYSTSGPNRRVSGVYVGVVLSAANRLAVYVPPGCAHGFQVLEDDTELFYQISAFYSAEHAAGVRWNDPAFAIEWPMTPTMMSGRDQELPDFGGGSLADVASR